MSRAREIADRDLAATELILDADNDTSITADTDDRIDFKVSNSDIIHMLSTGMGIGTNNPAHTLDLKASAPEIMLEETSSGGSKRLSLGVASDGTPFINAEQSGGVIAMNMTGTEVAKFNSNGLSFPSGKGLDFSATGDSSGRTAELLDDYEEGTWTPTLPSGGTVSSVGNARYTKIGRFVHVGAYFAMSAITNNSSTFYIGGLPYTVRPSSGYHCTGGVGYVASFNWAALDASDPLVLTNNTYIYFHVFDASTADIKQSSVQGLGELIVAVGYCTDG